MSTLKPILLKLLQFLAITVPLTWLWNSGGFEVYFEVFKALARPIFSELGVTTISPGTVRDRMLAYIPFLALMLITPGLPLARRLRRIALGFGLIFLSQIGLVYWAFESFRGGLSDAEASTRFFRATTFYDAFPFALWILLAREYVAYLLTQVIPAPAARAASGGPDAGEGRAEASERE